MTRVYEGLWTHRVVSSEPDIHGRALTGCGRLVRFDLTYFTRSSVTCRLCLGYEGGGDPVERIWKGIYSTHAVTETGEDAAFTECGKLAPVDDTRRVDAPYYEVVTCPDCMFEHEKR